MGHPHCGKTEKDDKHRRDGQSLHQGEAAVFSVVSMFAHQLTSVIRLRRIARDGQSGSSLSISSQILPSPQPAMICGPIPLFSHLTAYPCKLP